MTPQTTAVSYFVILRTYGGLNTVIMAISMGAATGCAMYAVMFNTSNGFLRSSIKSNLVGSRQLTLYQKHINGDQYEIVVALGPYEILELYGSTYLTPLTKVNDISGYTQITFS